MTDEINVLHRDQTIFVEPASGAISVIAAGPQGPPGPQGPKGDPSTVPGPPGAGTSTPKGIICSGPAWNPPILNGICPLNNVAFGPQSWLTGNRITLPQDAGGLWLIALVLDIQTTTIVGMAAHLVNAANQPYSPDMRVGVAAVLSSAAGSHGATYLRQCVGGDSFAVQFTGNSLAANAGYITVRSLSLVRLGDSLLPGVLEDEGGG